MRTENCCRIFWPCSIPIAIRTDSSVTATSACCGRASTMRDFSGRPIRRSRCWSARFAQERHLPKRSGQLLRQDAARATAVQLAQRDSQAEWDGGSARRHSQSCVPGEDRLDHRTGEGVHRTAGDRRRTCTRGRSNSMRACPRRRVSRLPTRFTITTSRSRPTTMSRVRSKERCCRSATRRTRLPGCSP